MDFNELKNNLEKSVIAFETIEKDFDGQLEEEIEALEKLLAFLMPVLPEVHIAGQRAVLIYVFEESKKRTIAPEVYYCEDGKIRYQVYEKEGYKNFNPLVEYEGAYAVVEAKKMFKTIDLSDVFGFFEERVDSLLLMAKEMEESRSIRQKYLKDFQKVSKKYL